MKDLEKLVATFNRAHTEDGKRVEHEFRAVWNAIPGLIEECMGARAVVEVARATHLLSFGASLLTPKRNAERLTAHRNLAAAIAAYDLAMEISRQ